MTREQLEAEATRKITNLKKAGLGRKSHAANILGDVFGRRTRQIKITNEKERAAAKAFIEAETSTVKGYKRMLKVKGENFRAQLKKFLPQVQGFTDEQKAFIIKVFDTMTFDELQQFADVYGDIFNAYADSQQQFIATNKRVLDNVSRYKTDSARRVINALLAKGNIEKEKAVIRRAQMAGFNFSNKEGEDIAEAIRTGGRI